nr:hypothetical protein [Tanacetum cinerariifolium]
QSFQQLHQFSSARGTFFTSSGNFFWQWKLITDSRKVFYFQQSSPKLDALSAIKFLEYNALPGEDAFNHFSVLDYLQSCGSSESVQ